MTMMPVLVLTALLAAQPAPDQRAEAERLARTGAHAEALARFQALVAENPEDVGARIWVGRLHFWMGHADWAEAVFRSVLSSHPDHVEAIVGLGAAITADDRPEEAIAVLDRAEALAPDDADVLAALGRAYLTAGHLRLAGAYYTRARLLRPADPDIRDGDERIRRIAGHRVEALGFFESFDFGVSDTWSGELEINLRVADGFRVFARGQQQRKFDETESRGGGGFEWRPNRRVTLVGRALLAPGALVLPESDVLGEVLYARKRLELTASARYADFDAARAWILSPGLTWWFSDRLAVTARYFHSETEFADSGGTSSNDSGLVRVRARLWPRVWVHGSYASGTESFETLSIDRLGEFRADTAGGGFQIDLPSLTTFAGAYEFQWRDNDTRMARVTVTLVQRF